LAPVERKRRGEDAGRNPVKAYRVLGCHLCTPKEKVKSENLKRARGDTNNKKRRKDPQMSQPNKPNHTPGSERSVPGTVARAVTSAENTKRAATTMCTFVKECTTAIAG